MFFWRCNTRIPPCRNDMAKKQDGRDTRRGHLVISIFFFYRAQAAHFSKRLSRLGVNINRDTEPHTPELENNPVFLNHLNPQITLLAFIEHHLAG